MPDSTFVSYPIGTIRTPFREKFGVPRQSMMMSEARACIKLKPDPQFAIGLRNLEQFSHIWVIFVFHQNGKKGWRPLIDTPRLEATQRMGVFATRSPHRPNPIGMSVVKLEAIDLEAKDGIEIHVSGVDILDGSPVLDIKPYLPYADRIEEANSGWIHSEIRRYPVSFSEKSEQVIEAYSAEDHPRIRALIEQMLMYDPRPSSQRRSAPLLAKSTESEAYAFRILGLDVHWCVRDGTIHVHKIVPLGSENQRG